MHSLQTQQAAANVKAALIALLIAVSDEYQLQAGDISACISVDETNDVSGSYFLTRGNVDLGGGSL